MPYSHPRAKAVRVPKTTRAIDSTVLFQLSEANGSLKGLWVSRGTGCWPSWAPSGQVPPLSQPGSLVASPPPAPHPSHSPSSRGRRSSSDPPADLSQAPALLPRPRPASESLPEPTVPAPGLPISGPSCHPLVSETCPPLPCPEEPGGTSASSGPLSAAPS